MPDLHNNDAKADALRTVPSARTRKRGWLETAGIAAVIVFGGFLLQSRLDLSLGDEGFYWYGAIRTAAGDLPIRDFRSYDVGRYYWAAGWLTLLGSDSVVSARLASAVFQWLGLIAALLALRRATTQRALLALCATVVWLWMFPLFRAYDTTLAAAGVLVAVLLIERPEQKRHVLAGVFTGVAACFGRNHGVYLLVGLASLAIYLARDLGWRTACRRLVALAAGVLVGYVPMMLLLATAPGFWPAFIEAVGSSPDSFNPRAVPWPWRRGYDVLPGWRGSSAFALGTFFLLLPAFYILAAMIVRRMGSESARNVVLGATFVGIPYVHAALSRSDVLHLATAIQPMLIGSLALFCAGRRGRLIGVAGLLVASGFAVGLRHPLAEYSFGGRQWVPMNVRGSDLLVEPGKARIVNEFLRWKHNVAAPGETLFLTPRWTTLYAVLDVEAPVWDVLPIFRATDAQQLVMLQDLDRKGVRWAATCERGVEGREDRTFRFTHPRVAERLTMWQVRPSALPAGCVLLERTP